MDTNRNPLARLTCSRGFSQQLIARGLMPWAHLWDVLDGEEYEPASLIPVWTKEELDVMLGPFITNIPRIPDPRMMGRHGDPLKHSWFGASKRIDYEKGADCSAAVLLYALADNGVKVQDANRRFLDVFKLVEKGLVDLSTLRVEL